MSVKANICDAIARILGKLKQAIVGQKVGNPVKDHEGAANEFKSAVDEVGIGGVAPVRIACAKQLAPYEPASDKPVSVKIDRFARELKPFDQLKFGGVK